MHRKFGKLGILSLAVVLCLATVGVGYAMWDKTLYIDGTVNTGEVNLEIMSASSDDPPGATDVNKDKDVGCTEVAVGADKQSITVTVTNGYPCYEVYVHFTVHNNGTVPVKLQDIIITNPNPSAITVSGWNAIGEQIDPDVRRDNTIWLHVEQEADELTQYTFTVEFYYVQWNEYTP